jgi:hypothetical protein
MRSSRRTILAVAITVAAAVIGMTAWALDRVDPGMTFGQGNDAQGRATLTIGSVTPGGLAWAPRRLTASGSPSSPDSCLPDGLPVAPLGEPRPGP